MQDEVMRKFLDGDVSDQEFSECETLIEAMGTESMGTVIKVDGSANGDSLMASLHSGKVSNQPESENSKLLTDRIESLIERQAVGREDLERILDPPKAPDELGRIGKYRVMEFIAAGGMGLVFKAEDTDLNRPVCIKVMHPALAMKPDAKIRFERESRAAARLRSERIVTLLDVGTQRELPYFVMPLLDGESLRSRLARLGKLPAESAIHYVRQIAEGLRHAHAMGIVHRDIKPDNIWITLEDDVKLLDFGLARALDESANLTTSGGLLGTPHYMSPEQIQGQSLDGRSDLFSVGIVLYEILTGELPFHKNNLFSTMIAITNDSVRLPFDASDLKIPCYLENLLGDLLCKSVKHRVQSAMALIERLQGEVQQSIVAPSAVIKSVRSTDGKWQNGSGWKVAAGVVLGMAATMLGVFLVDQQDKGTLVVRTNDPTVEVQIAKEKVTVNDPLTGRKYEISIGETPLRGGVYQLEMTNETGGLRFSSSTIAIRRGETTIVDVELQPRGALAAELPGLANNNPFMESKPAEHATKPPARIADQSYDPIARDKFRDVLPTLSSLGTNGTEEAAYGSQSANENSPTMRTLPGIRKWSIMPTSSAESRELAENSDRSLFASALGNYLLIKNGSGETKHLLPSAGPITGVRFCNLYPNLVSASVYLPSSTAPEMNGNKSYWIHVWRLDSDNAQLIYRFPSSSWDTSWDSGYRLAYHRDQQLAVFRLDLGESFDIAGPANETLPENAFSPKGNFLATQSYSSGQSAINVWDLHRGEFAFSVLDGTDAIWGTDVDRVAILTRRTSNREIWSLEKKAKEQSVDLPIDPNPRNTSPDRILASVLESSFMRLAWLTARGDLIIRNIQTNRQNSIRLPELEKPLLDSGTIRWAEDGTLLVGVRSEFRWTQTESEVHGILTPVSTTALDANKPKAPLQLNNAFGSLANTPTLKWSDKEATDRKSRNPSNRRINDSAYFAMADTWIQSFDLKANSFPQGVPAHTVSGVSFGQRLVTFENRGKGDFSVSPDGKYCVDARFSSNASSRQDGQELFLSTLTTSQPSVRLGVFAIDRSEQIIWQNGGPCVIVFENKSRQSNKGWPVFWLYDTQKMEWKDLTFLNLPTKDISQIIPYENRFLFVLKHSSTDSLQCWILDPFTLKTEESQFLTSQLSLFWEGRIFGVSKTLYFTKDSNNNTPVSIDSIPVRSYYRIPNMSSAVQAIEVVTAPAPNKLVFSPDGQFVLQDAPTVNGVSVSLYGGWEYKVDNGGKFITRWSDDAKSLDATPHAIDQAPLSTFQKKLFTLKGNFQGQLQWHHSSRTALWNQRGQLHFYDADREKLIVHSGYPAFALEQISVLSTDYGWLVCGGSQLYFFDPIGRFLGQLAFDPELKDNMPTNPRWILADGSTCSQCSQKGLYISFLKGSDFHTMPVDQFLKTHTDASLPTFDEIPFLKSTD